MYKKFPLRAQKLHNIISSEIGRGPLKFGPSWEWEVNKIIQKQHPNLGSWVAYTISIPISRWTWWDANFLMHLSMLIWRGPGSRAKAGIWTRSIFYGGGHHNWSEENTFSTPPIETRGQICFIESSNVL